MREGQEKSRRRRLPFLAGFWLFLAAQGAFAVVAFEPYPSLIMPSFAGAASANGDYPTERVEITIDYVDGPRLTTKSSELMDGFRFSSALPSIRYGFHPDGSGARRGLGDDPEVQSWMAERARELGDGREPAAVNFCWRDEVLDVNNGSVTDRDQCDEFRVTL